MAVDIEQPRRVGDDESFSTAATATENTPLLRSEAASSHTAADDLFVADAGTTPSNAAIGDEASVSSSAAASDEPWSRSRATCIILSMWALIFLQASNMSGITTTQSTIAADLDAYEYAMWFTSSYLITMSSVAPLVGRLSMIFSPGDMILISSLFFSLGAVVTSQARSFVVFIIGRILVGIGGGGVMTLALILVIQLTSKKRRGLWIGLTNAGFTIGMSTGAVIFGALLPVIGWRALFLVQSPIGILSGLGVYYSMPLGTGHTKNSKETRTTLQKLSGLDYAGALTLTLTIVFFLYGLSGTIQLTPIFLSIFTFMLFLFVESSIAKDPIIPLSVLRNRGVLLSCLSQLGFMAVRWTLLFYAPVFVLAVRGLSPAIAGSVLIPTNLGFGTGGLIVGWLHVKRAGSFWLPSLLSLALFGVFIFMLAFVSNAAAPTALYLFTVFGNGLCTGALLNYTLAHLLHLASPETHFIVTGLLATFRGFAGSFGTTIGGGIFARTLRDALTKGFRHLDGNHGGGQLSKAREKLITILMGSPAAVYQEGFLTAAERVVAVGGYERALRVLYQSAAAVCILVLVLQAGTGWTEPPVTVEQEEEIEEAIVQHDGRMEA